MLSQKLGTYMVGACICIAQELGMRLICMHLTTHHVLVTPSLTRFTVNHHRRWSNLSIEMSFFDYVDSQLIHYYWSIFGISLQQLGQDCNRTLPYHRRGLPSKSCTLIYTGLGLNAIQSIHALCIILFLYMVSEQLLIFAIFIPTCNLEL